MSHTVGTVLDREDGEPLGYFEYNGTVDMACTSVKPDVESVRLDWRSTRNMASCQNPTHEHVPVYLKSGYGSNFGWESDWCPSCRAITGYRDRWQAIEERERSSYMGLAGRPNKK